MFSLEMLLIISLRETKRRISEVIAAETAWRKECLPSHCKCWMVLIIVSKCLLCPSRCRSTRTLRLIQEILLPLRKPFFRESEPPCTEGPLWIFTPSSHPSFQASGFMSQRSPCSLICPIRWTASWLEPGPPSIILHWLSSNVPVQESLWGQKPIKCYPFSFIHYHFCYVIHFHLEGFL